MFGGRRRNQWFWVDALLLPLEMTDSEVVAPYDSCLTRHFPHLRVVGEGDWAVVGDGPGLSL